MLRFGGVFCSVDVHIHMRVIFSSLIFLVVNLFILFNFLFLFNLVFTLLLLSVALIINRNVTLYIVLI